MSLWGFFYFALISGVLGGLLCIRFPSRSLIWACIIFCLGLARTEFSQYQHDQWREDFGSANDQVLSLRVRVLTDAKQVGSGMSCEVKEVLTHHRFRVYFPATLSSDRYRIGDELRLMGTYQSPGPARNPGAVDTLKLALRRGLVGDIRAQRVTRLEGVSMFRRFVRQVQDQMIAIHQQSLSKDHARMVLAMMIGDRVLSLSSETYERFRLAGLTHILVVSGTQVSLFLAAMLCVMDWLRCSAWIRWPILVFSGMFFYVLTGGGASILRAVLLVLLSKAVHELYRRVHSLDALCLVGLIMAVVNPFYWVDVGAQLSFLATGSLLCLAPLLSSQLSRYLPLVLAQYMALSVAPFMLTAPVLAYHFHEASLMSVLSNFLLLFWVQCLLIWVIFVTMMGLISLSFSDALSGITSGALDLFEGMVTLCSDWGRALGFLMAKHAWLTWLLILLFGMSWGLVLGGISGSIWVLIVCCLAHGGLNLARVLMPPELSVWVLDVGQGESILIRLPDRRVILIDTGPRYYSGNTAVNRVLIPALRALGIRQIDMLIITHFDSDHVSGLSRLFSTVPVRYMFDNGLDLRLEPRVLADLAHFKGQRSSLVQSQRFSFEPDGELRVLFPRMGHAHVAHSNHNSLVMMLRFGQTRLLLMGDLEGGGERRLLEWGLDLRAQVLKVGHHGSKTSSISPFLDQVDPDYALISAGRRNRYSHPSDTVIKRLEARDIQVFRTDQHGALVLRSDLERWYVSGYQ